MGKVVIIGGGIAGLEAAGQLAALGHSPVIIEKSGRLGGHVALWHRLFPDMTPASRVLDDLIAAVRNTEIRTGCEISAINRLWQGFNVILPDGENIHADAILLASGFNLFEAEKKEEYGYGVYDHVITNADLEAWLNGDEDPRVVQNPRSIGFVHCVGSRDLKAGNSQCSKVCCVTAIKQAIEMKEKFPEAEIWCFYMDLRLFGKKYEDFYINAQKEFGIHFLRGRISEVCETIDGRVQVKAEDTLLGKPVKVSLDLLVLMSGMVCNSGIDTVARSLKVDFDSDGFLKSRDNICNIIESGSEGVFLAGAVSGTKTVPETLAEARAASLAIHKYLGGK